MKKLWLCSALLLGLAGPVSAAQTVALYDLPLRAQTGGAANLATLVNGQRATLLVVDATMQGLEAWLGEELEQLEPEQRAEVVLVVTSSRRVAAMPLSADFAARHEGLRIWLDVEATWFQSSSRPILPARIALDARGVVSGLLAGLRAGQPSLTTFMSDQRLVQSRAPAMPR